MNTLGRAFSLPILCKWSDACVYLCVLNVKFVPSGSMYVLTLLLLEVKTWRVMISNFQKYNITVTMQWGRRSMSPVQVLIQNIPQLFFSVPGGKGKLLQTPAIIGTFISPTSNLSNWQAKGHLNCVTANTCVSCARNSDTCSSAVRSFTWHATTFTEMHFYYRVSSII